MPLFGSRREPSPEPVVHTQPPPKKGLFHRHDPEPVYEQPPPPPQKKSLFGGGSSRRHEPEPAPPVQAEAAPRKHGIFGGSRRDRSPTRYSSSSRSSMSSADAHYADGRGAEHGRHGRRSGGLGGGLLSRKKDGVADDMDPSIVHARERVMGAEAAEMDADRALEQARLRVREAREDVKALEAEAKEDARRAKVKQQHFNEISKRGKGLGRHGL